MNRDDFKKLVKIRKKEAEILLKNNHWQGCYYLIGYTIECALKACICKQFTRYQYPDKKLVNELYIHDLQKLLNISGLKPVLEQDIKFNEDLEISWSTINSWTEQERYNLLRTEQEAKDIFKSCNCFLTWIKNKW